MTQESLFIPIGANDKLHLKRFYTKENGSPIFLLHGSIEDGKIYYSKNLKGLAPYLATQGYDVFVGDMQGRGLSEPTMNRQSKYGQVDVIKTDIPKFLEKIKSIKGNVPIHTMAHSWGGVLMLAYLARFEHNVKSLVLFGSKRQLTVRGPEYRKQLYLNWFILGRIMIWLYGYLPAKKYGIGSDNEPRNHYKQINAWLKPGSAWIDNIDGYDYGKSLETKEIPPCLFLAGKNDKLLGNPIDVKLLENEVKNAKKEYWLLAKEEGFAHDYDHIDMLTHKDAKEDTFPKVVAWLNKLG